MIKKIYSIFLLSTIILGCQEIRTVTRTELENAKARWTEPKVSIWYYMGTKEDFDYFIHEDIDKTVIYRIKSNEITLDGRFKFSTNRKNWRFMRWGVHALMNSSNITD